VAQIEAKRNDVLVDMMRLFKHHKVGAGLVLARDETRQGTKAKRWKKSDKLDGPGSSTKAKSSPPGSITTAT
jgi:hypothetical protein